MFNNQFTPFWPPPNLTFFLYYSIIVIHSSWVQPKKTIHAWNLISVHNTLRGCAGFLLKGRCYVAPSCYLVQTFSSSLSQIHASLSFCYTRIFWNREQCLPVYTWKGYHIWVCVFVCLFWFLFCLFCFCFFLQMKDFHFPLFQGLE